MPHPTKKPIARRPNHLRAWREHRKLTQEDLAAKVGTTKGVISLIESAQRGLSDKWLHRLAPVLKIKPGWLLDVDPNEIPGDLLEVWGDIPETKRPEAMAVLKVFSRKTGT